MPGEDGSVQTEVSKLMGRVDEAINSHKNMTKDQLAELARDLRDELAAARKESDELTSAQIKELREGLTDIQQFVTDQREAAKQKDRVVESESTLVVPPDDVIPAPPIPAGEEPAYDDSGEGDRKSLLKRLW